MRHPKILYSTDLHLWLTKFFSLFHLLFKNRNFLHCDAGKVIIFELQNKIITAAVHLLMIFPNDAVSVDGEDPIARSKTASISWTTRIYGTNELGLPLFCVQIVSVFLEIPIAL